MSRNFSFSFSRNINQTVDPSGNVSQQLSSALSGLRESLQEELSKALSGIGVSSNCSIYWEPSELLTESEEQISQAQAGMPNRDISDTSCEIVTMPSGRLANLSCIVPTNDGLSITMEEYRTIVREMQETIVDHVSCSSVGGCFSSYEVVKIQKLYNSTLYEQYSRIKSEVIAEHGSANEHMLFHGSAHIPEIMYAGFNTEYANPNGLFGAGIYFAKHSSKSNQYAFGYLGGTGCPSHSNKNCYVCERQLLFCRVILGNEYNVTKSTRVKSLPYGYHSLKGVAGKGLRYPEYVVYKGKQAYPEYVITYRIVQ